MMTNEQYIKERYLLEYRRRSTCKKANKMEERAFKWWSDTSIFKNGFGRWSDWIPYLEVRVKNNNITQWLNDHPEIHDGQFTYCYVGDQHWHNVYMIHRRVGPWIH